MISLPTGLVTLTLTKLVPVWQFPFDRFIEYESSDEAWARPLGFGREVMEPRKVVIPNVRITHFSADGKAQAVIEARP